MNVKCNILNCLKNVTGYCTSEKCIWILRKQNTIKVRKINKWDLEGK